MRLGARERRGAWRMSLAMPGTAPPGWQLVGEINRRDSTRDMLPMAALRAGNETPRLDVVLGLKSAAKIFLPRTHPMCDRVRLVSSPRRQQSAKAVSRLCVAPIYTPVAAMFPRSIFSHVASPISVCVPSQRFPPRAPSPASFPQRNRRPEQPSNRHPLLRVGSLR